MNRHNAYLAIDAGGTFLKSAVIDSEGTLFEGSGYKTLARSEGSREEIMQGFEATIRHALEFMKIRGLELKGIGVASPGPFDFRHGISLMKHKFMNIYGISLPEAFCRIPGVSSDIPIRFLHDVNAVLIGEQWKGNARGFANIAVVTLGTGLGFTYTVNHELQCNELGSPAVAIYKFPYREGILEEYTAKRGVMRIYRDITGIEDIDGIEVSDIGRMADEGDTYCIETFRMIGKILAGSLKELLHRNQIQCLLFGGQISRSFCHMEAELFNNLNDLEALKKISMVKSINNAALLGALKAIGSPELCF